MRLLILDVDGVMTDGGITLDGEGGEQKTFNVRDGHGIKLLQGAGIEVAIITGRSSRAVTLRARELGIKQVYQNCRDKPAACARLIKKLSLTKQETAFLGDDVVDIGAMAASGLSVAVSDAVPEAKATAMMVTKQAGGKGAVRELAEFILKSKGLWAGIVDEYRKA